MYINNSFREFYCFENLISNNYSIEDFIEFQDLYYQPYSSSLRYYLTIEDLPMFFGKIKIRPGIREMKSIAKYGLFDKIEEIVNNIFKIFKDVQDRTISYRREDIRVLESIHNYYCGIPNNYHDEIFDVPINSCLNQLDKNNTITEDKILYEAMKSSFNNNYEIELISQKFNNIINLITKPDLNGKVEISKNLENDIKNLLKDLTIIYYIPYCTLLFSRLLMYVYVLSEILESFIILKDNLYDSIYGRFRMWMIRNPTYTQSFNDWTIFMKWRTFIFSKVINLVPESDKKKVSSELCKLNILYASKAFKDKMYNKCSYILNDPNIMNTPEASLNITKYILDIEALYESKEYATIVSVVNSINITRFSSEDKSLLYYWACKALKKLKKNSEAEKYNNISNKIANIILNKKEALNNLREKYNKALEEFNMDIRRV